MNFGFSMGKRTEAGREDWMRYSDASIVVGDAEFNELAEAAKRAGAYVSIGFSERDAVGHYARPDVLELIVHDK